MNDRRELRLGQPGRVVRLLLEEGDGGLTLSLTLQPQGDARPEELRFSGVRELRFVGPTVALLQHLGLLLAEDVSSWGWEGVRFRVRDAEEELLSFLCADIEPPPR